MAPTAYVDADHAGCQDTRRSTSGSAQFLRDKLINTLDEKDSILQAGNPVKEILLKLNLPDHRSILTDSKVHIKMVMEIPGSNCCPLEVIKCHKHKTAKDHKLMIKRLDLADDLKEAHDHISSTNTSPKTKTTTSMYKTSHEESKSTS
ncbi:hypothetical protein Tco_0600932 [Tanacetum coccineum]